MKANRDKLWLVLWVPMIGLLSLAVEADPQVSYISYANETLRANSKSSFQKTAIQAIQKESFKNKEKEYLTTAEQAFKDPRKISLPTPQSGALSVVSYQAVAASALKASHELYRSTVGSLPQKFNFQETAQRAFDSDQKTKLPLKVNVAYQETANEAFSQFSKELNHKIQLTQQEFESAGSEKAKHITYLNMMLPTTADESGASTEGPDRIPAKGVQETTVQLPVSQENGGAPTQPGAVSTESAEPSASASHFSLGNKLGLGPKSRIQIDGFLSTGSVKTNANNTGIVNTPFGPESVPVEYNIPAHGAVGDHWDFTTPTLVGLQVTGRITDFLSAVVQLVADGDDTNGNNPYRVQAQWAFLRTKVGDSFEARAGRFRLPAFMYSETQQVGYTYPWLFLPNEVYRIFPFENVNGVDLIYTLPLGNTGWDVQAQPYYGEETSEFDLYTRGFININGSPAVIPQGKTADFDNHNIFGFVLNFGNPYFSFRGTYVHTNVSAFVPNFIVPNFGETDLPLFNDQPGNFYSFGARMDWHRVLFVSEFADRTTPPQVASLLGYYAMIGVHLGTFLPNFTYAKIKTTNQNALLSQPVSEFPQNQHSYTLGLSYFINSNVVAKSSVSFIQPSGNGLFTTNPGRSTVLFYGFGLDAIF